MVDCNLIFDKHFHLFLFENPNQLITTQDSVLGNEQFIDLKVAEDFEVENNRRHH